MSFQTLFNSIPKDRTKIRGGRTQGYVQKKQENITKYKYTPNEGKGVEYVAKYKEKEEREYFESMPSGIQDLNKQDLNAMKSTMEEAEELTSVGTLPNVGELNREDLTQVYNRYQFTPFNPSEQLESIHNDREKILEMIDNYQACIIEGPTGCGKTTQIPQFILDQHIKQQEHCNIVVTQPRRIAAKALADRVCTERGWQLGQLVGYQIGLDKTASEDTRLLYCTTGVLLEKLISAKNLLEFTHIVLDEIHEREEDMDFLILVVRRFMRTNSRNVKVILMSATMDKNRFVQYFEYRVGNPNQQTRCAAPYLKVGGDRKFNVQVHYLEAIGSIAQKIPDITENEPGISQEGYNLIPSMIRAFNVIDEKDYEKKRSSNKKGAVLIFLPGLHQIETLHELLEQEDKKDPHAFNLWLRPLHSSITRDEQENVYRYAPVTEYGEQRKVILSTNIAESSVTIPDVKYVIDFCLTKHLVADPVTGFTSLHLAWASHTNCIQREGRAGRVQDGRVYRLVPRDFYEFKMPKESRPEMQRCPLDILVLKCKKLFENECALNLLACAMDPPDLGNYEKTVLKLKEVGALRTTCTQTGPGGAVETVYKRDDGDLTYMGHVMAQLPLDIHISKLILLGHAFNVLDDVIIMGCAMTTRNMFCEPFRERLQAYNNKLLWADSSESDAIAYFNAYSVWRIFKAISKYERSRGSEESWARRYYLQKKHLEEVGNLQKDIQKRLKFLNIENTRDCVWSSAQKPLILKIVLAGAFYPHYFSRSHQTTMTDADAVKELSGQDPYKSVYFTNMPHPAPLYIDTVKKQLAAKGVSQNVTCHSDDSKKLIVSFNVDDVNAPETVAIQPTKVQLHKGIPGLIFMPVYRALKLRQLNESIYIKLLPLEQVREQVDKLNKVPLQLSPNELKIPLDKEYLDLQVTHVEDAGHFYGHILPKGVEFGEIHSSLNSMEYNALQPLSNIYEGMICVAPFTEDEESEDAYYRARVTTIKLNDMVEVFYIDFGNTATVPKEDLFELSDAKKWSKIKEYPPLALHCVLAEVGPSKYRSVRGQWSKEATSFVKKNIESSNFFVFLKIYSYRDSVASVYVYLDRPIVQYNEVEETTLNTILIERGMAMEREENYFSKVDHYHRTEASRLESANFRVTEEKHEKRDNMGYFGRKDLSALPTETPGNSSSSVYLKGPHSPLEMKLHSTVQCSIEKEVKVEWNSVNSVLLDSDPEDPHERFLIAASVSQSSDSKRLTLNHTTVLPNIPGLAHLVCVLFAPTVELRTDEEISRYTGALCGLGTHDNIPVFPENDIEVNFDVQFTQDDFVDINKFRYWMNNALYSSSASERDESSIIMTQKSIKELVTTLVKKKRRSVKVYRYPFKYRWGTIPQEVLLDPFPKTEKAVFDDMVYTLHNLIQINPENDRVYIEKELDKLAKLEQFIERGVGLKELQCSLCEVDFQYANQLRLHLSSTYHKRLKKWLVERSSAHK